MEEKVDTVEIHNQSEPVISITDTPEYKSLLTDLDNKSQRLQELEIKFDIWQSNVEPMLATAQTAMQYDNYVLTFLAIIIALGSFVFQKWASKSKHQAIEEAIESVERTIAKGILPKRSGIRKKLLDSILKSDEFTVAVKEANKFIDASDDVDEELLEELEESSEQIGEENIKRATEQEESEKTSGEKNKSDTLKKKKTSQAGKGKNND